MSTARDLAGYYRRQFEEDSSGILYRHKGSGPAFKVSAIERDTYLEETNRAARRAVFWLTTIMFAGLITTIIVAVSIGSTHIDLITPVGMAFTILAATIPYFRILHAPSSKFEQILSGRLYVKPALSYQETRRLRLSRISYGQLAFAPVFGLIVAFGKGTGPADSWSRYWWLLPIGLGILAGVQAFRKWRYTSR